MDNGPESTGKALDEWAYRKGVTLNFTRPGKPIDKAYVESFNGKFRDECLNTNWFMNVKHARDIIEYWRQDPKRVCCNNDRTLIRGDTNSGGMSHRAKADAGRWAVMDLNPSTT
jgi:hypothetical protein